MVRTWLGFCLFASWIYLARREIHRRGSFQPDGFPLQATSRTPYRLFSALIVSPRAVMGNDLTVKASFHSLCINEILGLSSYSDYNRTPNLTRSRPAPTLILPDLRFSSTECNPVLLRPRSWKALAPWWVHLSDCPSSPDSQS